MYSICSEIFGQKKVKLIFALLKAKYFKTNFLLKIKTINELLSVVNNVFVKKKEKFFDSIQVKFKLLNFLF